MKLPVLLFSGLLLCSAPAFAQSSECETDADCGAHEVCETYTFEACPACEPGVECGPCAVDSGSHCTVGPPTSCSSDADCEDGTLCVRFSFESCSAPGWSGPCDDNGEPCEVPPTDEVTCEVEEQNLCVPPFLAPCAVDADCGEGFTCEDLEVCSCSSSPRPPGEDDDGDFAPEPCECEPTGDTYCALIHTFCETDADCPSGMECLVGETPAIACEPADSCEQLPGEAPFCAPRNYGGGYSDAVGEASGRDDANVTGASREGFFEPDSFGGGGGKTEGGGCSTANANAGNASLLGLLLGGMMIGRRRR